MMKMEEFEKKVGGGGDGGDGLEVVEGGRGVRRCSRF
jgi:hypothetical protein